MLGTKIDQSNWAFPEKTTLQGQYVTLEPLSLNHLSDLWAEAKSAPDSFSYLRYGPFDRSIFTHRPTVLGSHRQHWFRAWLAVNLRCRSRCWCV